MAGELQPIQIKIQATGADEATKSILSVTNALKQLQAVSGQVSNVMTNFGNTINKTSIKNTFTDFSNAQIKNNNNINKVTKSTKKLSSGFNLLGKSGLSTIVTLFTMQKASKYLNQAFEESASWVENLNVMEVAFGNMSESAYKFVSSVASGFGLDKNELLEYVSLFQQMASAMGQSTETAYMMSTALTLLGTDVSSLYNKDIKVTMEALRSAIAGQVKPVRQFGFDITSYSIDGLIEQMGILEGYTSRMMTQSQKQLARTILLIQQSKNAWGDLGKTLDTYSNQQKILSAQFTNLKRAIGDLFIGTKDNAGIATRILYTMNGILMTIVETIRFFIPEATSSGFNEVQEDLEETEKEFENLEDTVNGSLLSFDKFNTLSNGKGKGDNAITSMLEKTLAEEYSLYLEQWQKRMEKVSSRAHEIRDTIMEWLGFVKEISTYTEKIENDPNTPDDDVYLEFSEVNWALAQGETRVKFIKDLFNEIYQTIQIIRTSLREIFGTFMDDTDFSKNIQETFAVLRRTLSLFLDVGEGAIPYLFEKILTLLNAIIPSMNKLATITLDAIEKIFSNENLRTFLDEVFEFVTTFLPMVINTLSPVLKLISSIANVLLDLVLPVINELLGFINEFVSWYDSWATPFNEKTIDFITWLVDGIGVLLEFLRKIENVIKAIMKYLGEGLLEGLKNFFEWIGNHLRGKSSLRLGMYANGGYPDVGSLFIANERGPELVGNIGGRTSVANNDMIVQAIENASYRGMMRATQSNNGANNVNLKIDANSNDLSRALAKSMAIELKRQGYNI